MDLPVNTFKQAILAGRQQIGLWCTLGHPHTLELLAGSGFDWLLVDTEHSPSDIENVLAQLQAAAPYPVAVAVRPAWNDAVLIKRLLDIGAQTLLVPFVQDEAEAARAVAATRYPPAGVRGVAGTSRATRYGRIAGYAQRAAEQLCLLVQVETPQAIERIERIAAVDGVDGIFVGPADLAASMGHAGSPAHPEVQRAVEAALARIRACGKAAGVLTPDEALARRCIDAGSVFTAVGSDAGLLARQTEALARRFGAGAA